MHAQKTGLISFQRNVILGLLLAPDRRPLTVIAGGKA